MNDSRLVDVELCVSESSHIPRESSKIFRIKDKNPAGIVQITEVRLGSVKELTRVNWCHLMHGSCLLGFVDLPIVII